MGKKKAKKRGGGGKAAGATPAPAPEPAPAPALRGFWDGTLAPTGDAPSPRGGHSATVLGSLLYVFGGADRTPATHGDDKDAEAETTPRCGTACGWCG